MKKYSIIIVLCLLVFLIFSISSVNANEDVMDNIEVNGSVSNLDMVKVSSSSAANNIVSNLSGVTISNNSNNKSSNKINGKLTVKVNGSYYKSTKLSITFNNKDNNKALTNQKLSIKFSNGKAINLTTNSKGIATYNIPYKIGNYKVTVSSLNNNIIINPVSSKFTIKKGYAKVYASSVSAYYKSGKYFTVKVVNSKNKAPLVSAKVKLKVFTGKKYKTVYVYTNTTGIAKYSTSSCGVGSHKVVISSAESTKNLVLSPKTLTKTIKINKAKTSLSINDIYINNNSLLKITLKAGKYNLVNKTVKLVIGDDFNKTYSQKTDKNGVANFKIIANFKEYPISYSFAGDSSYLASSASKIIEVIDGANSIRVNNFKELKDALNKIKSLDSNSLSSNKYYIILNGGNYIATETLYLDNFTDKILTIAGYNQIIKGNNSVSFINIAKDNNLILKNIKLNNFNTALFNNGNLTVKSCDISNNSGFEGSAIFNNIHSNLEVYNSKFTDNTGNLGACIYASEYVNSYIFNSTFNKNVASGDAGAIYNDNNSNLTVINCILSNNYARSNGGAIYNKHNLVSKNNKYTNNFIDVNGGGAIYNYGFANLTSLNDIFDNNNVNFTGGAIHSQYSSVAYIENATFKSNKARYNKGGAIYNFENSVMVIKNSVFTENYASRYGGVIFNKGNSNLTLINTTFKNNNAGTGGVIYNMESAYIFMNNSKFNNNSASSGGVIYSEASKLDGYNLNFSNNYGTNGGCIYLTSTSYINLVNSSFINNSASSGGVMYLNGDNYLYINSSEFNSNHASSDGGVIYNSGAYVEINSSQFNNNSGIDGGVMANLNEAIVIVNNNNFSNSYAELGGVMYNYIHKILGNQVITLEGNLFNNSIATVNGGAIYNYNVSCIASNNNFISNEAKSSGGAIHNDMFTKITSSNNYFENNTAFNGGAISNVLVSLNSSNDKFINNKATVACALYVDNSTLNVLNGTFIGNNNTSIDAYALLDLDNSIISIDVSTESTDDLNARKTVKEIDSIIIPDSYLDANEDGVYTLTKDQYSAVIQLDSYFLYLKQSLPKYVYFQDITGAWYKISREKWNVIEKEINTKMVLADSMDKFESITVDLKNKSCTYPVVRDQ